VHAARDRMVALGATIVPIELPDVEPMATTFTDLFDIEMCAAHTGLYPERAADYGPATRHALAHFTSRNPHIHVAGAIESRAFRQRIDRLFDEVDVLLCSVSQLTASPYVSDDLITSIFEHDHRNIIRLTRLTSYWNLAGTPAISLPWGFDRDGMP